jgi:uncharacterized membrane protein
MTPVLKLNFAIQPLPTSPAVVTTLYQHDKVEMVSEKTSLSKGKLFSKDAPVITSTPPIAPITPPTTDNDQTINLIAVIAAMMTAVQSMELFISELMSTITGLESKMQSEAATANAYCEKQAIAKQAEADEKAEKAGKLGDVMKIVGYVAAAVICIASVGTLSAVSALIIIAITVADTCGALQDAVNALLKACKVDPDSTLGAILSAFIKIVIIIAATGGTGAAEEASSASEAGAKAGTEAGSSGSSSAAADASNEVADASQSAIQNAKAPEEATAAAKAAKDSNVSIARRLAFSNTFGSLNPLGDIGDAIARAANHGKKDDAIEGWINMATAIISSLIGMAAMFSAIQAAENTGSALDKALDNPQTLAKITKGLSNLSLALNLAAAGIQIDIGSIKMEQGQDEKDLGKLQGTSDEIKSLNEMFQTIALDQQKWMKQNTALDKQLSDSFEYAEFANFAQVQLHG